MDTMDKALVYETRDSGFETPAESVQVMIHKTSLESHTKMGIQVMIHKTSLESHTKMGRVGF